MEYEFLGRSGLRISRLCLGGMMFGGPTDAATSERIIGRAFDSGMNVIDTADQYHAGESERIIGKAIRSNRPDWILSTKLANAMGTRPNMSGLSRKWIIQAAENSLKRLGTDFIDIYYLHREDLDASLEGIVSAMGDLIASGKIRYFGLSNHRAWRVAEICNLCDRMGVDRPVASQPYYNAMNRMPEVEHLPACRHYGLGVIAYSPLARGILTGKYDPKAPPPADTRAGRQDRRMLETEWREESLGIAGTVREHAAQAGATSIQFAVRWVLNNRLVSATLIGPRTEEQLHSYLSALEYEFRREDEDLIDGLVVTGHPSTPGFNDPHYPIEGRIPRTGASAGNDPRHS